MMSMMQKYFSYHGEETYGIPSVTLDGQKEDWEKIIESCTWSCAPGVAACRVLLLVAALYVINAAPECFLADISARGSVARYALKSIATCAPIPRRSNKSPQDENL